MSGAVHVSIGHTGFWGYSASFDVLEALVRRANVAGAGGGQDLSSVGSDDGEPIRVLLVHPGDIRHILTTVSRRQRHHGAKSRLTPFRPIYFYLLENPLEVLSRSILLLEALNDYEVPIRQRAAIFLEIFGNCRVQDRTSRYIEQLGHELRAFIAACTGRGSSGRLDGILDLSLLKYREKDELEASFRNYSRSTAFDMDTLRDHRMRGLYEERYDSRKNLADWDYHQHFKSRASIIHIKQFKEWRLSGTGFELGDQVYSEPNRTLLSYVEGVIKKGKDKGERKGVLGFWGDIVGGPFFSFGIDSDVPDKHAEGLYEILNKNTGTEQHRHHTVEIAMYNLFSMLWEIETGTVYRMKKKNDIYSGLGSDDLSRNVEEPPPRPPAASPIEEEGMVEEEGGVAEEEGGAAEEEGGEDKDGGVERGEGGGGGTSSKLPVAPVPDDDVATLAAPAVPGAQAEEELARAIQRAECIVETWANVKVFPMVGNPSSVLDKPRFHGLFDAVFVSARAASCTEHDWFAQLVKPGTGLVAVESSKFLVPLSREQKAEFVRKEEGFAAKHGWTRITPPPVFRRRRDEADNEDDVLFFK